MSLRKFFTNDSRYVVIVEEYSHYSDYNAFDVSDDFVVEGNKDRDANTFYKVCAKEDIKPQVRMSIKWDGCVNMNGMADGVMTHFCYMEDIESYTNLLKECYEDAVKTIIR